jgi:tripeptide aminopeptidase
MDSSKVRGIASADGGGLDMQSRALGIRPGGELPANSSLLQAVTDADRFLGNRSRSERSSTDANVPLSMGIPAIAMGGGGRAGGSHTVGEWYDPAGREMGLQRILLTLLSTAGIER